MKLGCRDVRFNYDVRPSQDSKRILASDQAQDIALLSSI